MKKEKKVAEVNNESKSDKMLALLKAMSHNEKMIARFESKIQKIKELNEQLSSEFKTILDSDK